MPQCPRPMPVSENAKRFQADIYCSLTATGGGALSSLHPLPIELTSGAEHAFVSVGAIWLRWRSRLCCDGVGKSLPGPRATARGSSGRAGHSVRLATLDVARSGRLGSGSLSRAAAQ